MKTKKKSGKNLRKSGKSRGKIREFDGIKKVGTLINWTIEMAVSQLNYQTVFTWKNCGNKTNLRNLLLIEKVVKNMIFFCSKNFSVRKKSV